MLMKIKQLVLLLLISKIAFSQTTNFKINEYSFSNVNTVVDQLGNNPDSRTPDWIEIRTFGIIKGNLQQLSGIYISDDHSNLHKWQIPYHNNLPIKLDSGQVQLVFLCGHDKGLNSGLDTSGVELHANFKVNQTKKGGAVIYLTKSVNALVPFDSVQVKISKPDHSWGRCWEQTYLQPGCVVNCVHWWNSNIWRLYAKPTPRRYNPKWPFYYTDYLPKPVFDIKPGYISSLAGNVTISDTSKLSALSAPQPFGTYTNYPSICIIATNDCTSPDTFNTYGPVATGTIVNTSPPVLGTPVTGTFPITSASSATWVPPPTGFMIRATMHDGTTNPSATPTFTNGVTVMSFTATPRYLDSFEAYGAFYDSLHNIPLTFVCVDTSTLFAVAPTATAVAAAIADTAGVSIDYFDKTGKEIIRNQGQAMISKLDFLNPIGPSNPAKQWHFDFRAEDEYGYNYTNNYQYFQDAVVGASPRADFPELIFRAGSQEGFLYDANVLGPNFYPPAHIRDYFNHTMTMRHKLNFEQAHYTPTYMLINGVNKGIYYIKEPFDSTYTGYYFNRPRAAILGNGIVTTGTTTSSYSAFTSQAYAGFGSPTIQGYNAVFEWNTFYTWAMSNATNVHLPAVYNSVGNLVDFASLNDYTIYNMLSVNSDYVNRSAYWWKGVSTDTLWDKRQDTKWRFGLANTDITWGFDQYIYNGIAGNPTSSPCEFINGFGYGSFPPPTTAPSNHQIVSLWYKLMGNDTFKNDFISRYEDLLNSALSCDSLEDHLKYIRTQLPPLDMASHVWSLITNPNGAPAGMDSLRYWYSALDSMKSFIAQRCSLVTEGMKNCFGIDGPYNLCVDAKPDKSGYVLLNSLTLKSFVWNGKYLDSVKMVAHAIPEQNYVFDHWETNPTSYALHPDDKSDSINFFVSRDVCIKAVFKLKPADQTFGTPQIPTGFSPNGDGNNDIFNIYGTANATSYELEVYNRWGEMIFHSNDKANGWDGTFNGVPVPVGVYAYRYDIMVDNKPYKSKGSITLLR
jgi:gliding motility-associated-like protein